MPDPAPAPSPTPATPRPRRRPWLKLPFDDRYADALNIPVAYAERADLRDGLALGGVKEAHITDLEALLVPVRDAIKAVTTTHRLATEATVAAQLAMATVEEAMVEVSDRTSAAAKLHPELATAFRVGRRASKRLARIAQLRRLHTAAVDHERLLADEHGLTPEHLTDADAALTEAHKAALAAERRDVEAQDATHTRDEAMAPVDRAVRAIQTRSGPLGRRDPQLLELIGLRPR